AGDRVGDPLLRRSGPSGPGEGGRDPRGEEGAPGDKDGGDQDPRQDPEQDQGEDAGLPGRAARRPALRDEGGARPGARREVGGHRRPYRHKGGAHRGGRVAAQVRKALREGGRQAPEGDTAPRPSWDWEDDDREGRRERER